MRVEEAAGVDETASIERLIRTVVEQRCDGNCEVSEEDGNGEEVLIDVEVDGSRYLVIRLPKPTQRDVQLSPREQEIVRLVAQGHPNKIIADVLNISAWTVCTHIRRIFSKLGVGSRAAMIARLGGPGRSAGATAGYELASPGRETVARRTPQSARAAQR
ncbi:MAG: response regulator transcription factor [Acidobacteriaceae bacterium]|nr:response regulator transcription factor [Acidobacteriaceae bacterium]